MASAALRRFVPLFDRVLVEKAIAETKTKGGIMIPEKAQQKKGEVTPPSVTVGDEVLLPEYGGTKVVLDDKEYFLFRDSDLLGKFKSN